MLNESVVKSVRKISPRVITGGPIDPSSVQEPRDLYDLFGIVVATRARQTVNAAWLEFVGDFEAITFDGTVFRAPRCQLPPTLEDSLFSQLMDIHAKDPKASVQFAVRIAVVPLPKGKSSAVGYEYRVTPLVESRESNPLALLRENAYKTQGAQSNMRAIGGGGTKK